MNKPDDKRIEEEIISHRHDKFFRSALDNRMVARELAENHLPLELKKITDLDSLKVEKGSFVEKNLQKTICDVLMSAKIKGEDGYIFFLFEAQVHPDYWMGLRLIRYMINICTRYLKNHPEATKLPLVYPIVIYNGKQEYNAALNFWDLFADSLLAKKIWMEDHLVINVHKIPDERLTKQLWAGSLEYMLKHIFDQDLIKSWERFKDVIPKLAEAKDTGLDYLELMLHYTLTGMKIDDKMGLEKVLKSYLEPKDEERIMGSLAYHFMEEGIEKGRAEGIEKGVEKGIEKGVEKTAINMLKQGLDIKLIAKVTDLPMLRVRKLKAKLMK